MKIRQTVALSAYPKGLRVDVLETFFEAQVRVNMVFLLAHEDLPDLYDAGIRYRREGMPERWKDIPTILRDGYDDCEGLSCWRAAELRVREGIETAKVHLIRQRRNPNLLHAVVIDAANPRRRWDPSRVLGMKSGGTSRNKTRRKRREHTREPSRNQARPNRTATQPRGKVARSANASP